MDIYKIIRTLKAKYPDTGARGYGTGLIDNIFHNQFLNYLSKPTNQMVISKRTFLGFLHALYQDGYWKETKAQFRKFVEQNHLVLNDWLESDEDFAVLSSHSTGFEIIYSLKREKWSV